MLPLCVLRLLLRPLLSSSAAAAGVTAAAVTHATAEASATEATSTEAASAAEAPAASGRPTVIVSVAVEQTVPEEIIQLSASAPVEKPLGKAPATAAGQH